MLNRTVNYNQMITQSPKPTALQLCTINPSPYPPRSPLWWMAHVVGAVLTGLPGWRSRSRGGFGRGRGGGRGVAPAPRRALVVVGLGRAGGHLEVSVLFRYSEQLLSTARNCKMSTWTSANRCPLISSDWLSASTMSFKANMLFYPPMVCGKALKAKKLK